MEPDRQRGRPRPRAARGRITITDSDRRALQLAAEHSFVTAAQVAEWLGVSDSAAGARLRRLEQRALVGRSPTQPHGEPTWYQIERHGLRVIGSDLRRPGAVYLADPRHDRGLVWLMLLARRGCFGPISEVIGERRMRSEDARRVNGDLRHGVRRGPSGASGRGGLHYPDMVLRTADGRRVAFELELKTKPRDAREQILAAYGADRTVDAVVYLVETAAAARAVQRSVARVGLEQLVHVQRVAIEGGLQRSGTRGATPRHQRARDVGRESAEGSR